MVGAIRRGGDHAFDNEEFDELDQEQDRTEKESGSIDDILELSRKDTFYSTLRRYDQKETDTYELEHHDILEEEDE